MTVEEIMTRAVITVSPETPIHEAARLMVEHRVSGLPVVDADGRVVGLISDGDLILRQRRRGPHIPWWRSFFDRGEQLAEEYRKAVGTAVGDVMSRPVVVISPVWDIEVAASILDTRGFRRLPVVVDGRLVGIVSRADLIRALARGRGTPRLHEAPVPQPGRSLPSVPSR
jgi:CBS domain-containing protein